jgi:hypothetical protein
MDTRLDKDPPREDPTQRLQRFATLGEEQGAMYPMMAPAAAVTLGHEEDAFDEQILAGLVNV